MIKNTVFFVILIIFYQTSAQRLVSFSGTVVDGQNDPLPGITILLINTKLGAVTNERGYFVITDIPQGTYMATVSGLGYEKQEVELVFIGREQLERTVILEESISQLDEVVIAAESEANRLERTAQAVQVVETKELKLRTVDLGQVISKVEGVNVQRAGGLGSDTRFSLNGLTDDQIRFFKDGIPLEFIGYTFGIANVPVNLIDRLEIYKGVVPIRFGADALGGAVNLVSPRNFEGTGGSFSYQYGSFNTHRATFDLQHHPDESALFVTASAFYDFSLNNYEIDVEAAEPSGQTFDVTVPRFHDTYEAYGITGEVGWKDAKWADRFGINVFASRYDQELQHNNLMTLPYGEPIFNESSNGLAIHWEQDIATSWSLDLLAGYSMIRSNFVDTSSCVYNWFGECFDQSPRPGESGMLATDRIVSDHNYYTRFFSSYAPKEGHQLSLSIAPSYTTRDGDERVVVNPDEKDPLTAQQEVMTFINGIEHEWKASNDKLNNILFAKHYLQRVTLEEFRSDDESDVDTRTSTDFGFGNSLRFKLNSRWLAKASYEYAIRLPRAQEVLGDGLLILANTDLLPERSHNMNLEISYQLSRPNKADLKVGLNGFYRQAEELIVLLATSRFFSYQNVFAATSRGAELSLGWESPDDQLILDGNFTWLDFRNNSDQGPFSFFDGDRIPNRPYVFGNLSAMFNIPEIFYSSDRLSIFWNSRYVNKFFRSWESAAAGTDKDFVPSQFVQNGGVTYKIGVRDTFFSLTVESQNIFNEKVFDFFGVQRPGRSFFTKLTYQF